MTSQGKLVPAFAPVEDAGCFEEAYKSFTYGDDVALFSDLITFNNMAMLFADFDLPGFDAAAHDPRDKDIVVKGAVLEDGSIKLDDGAILQVEDLWSQFDLDVPAFGNGLRL